MNSTMAEHYVQCLDMQMWITTSFISYCKYAHVDFAPQKGSNPICVSYLKTH